MAKPFVIDRVRSLSQEEGLNDSEIAAIMEYSRISIQRIRKENNIPTANRENRKDKPCKCTVCQKIFHIRRWESNKIACEDCEKELEKAFDTNRN